MRFDWLKSSFSRLQMIKFAGMVLFLILDGSLSATAQLIVLAVYFEIIWASILLYDSKSEK